MLLESPEAQRLKAIQSKEAEYYVQDQLVKVCEKLSLPLVVLRGVQTYSDVGKHLTEFGIKFSKLRCDRRFILLHIVSCFVIFK